MSKNVFTLGGRALKLNTAEDIEPHIEKLKLNESVEEVWLNGNTLGIGACEALADALRGKKNLKVFPLLSYCQHNSPDTFLSMYG